MYSNEFKEMTDLEYVLRFALHVLEENELDHTNSKENWNLGMAIERELEKLKQ